MNAVFYALYRMLSYALYNVLLCSNDKDPGPCYLYKRYNRDPPSRLPFREVELELHC